MLNLTFGEQVKIVLSRKGMTIKELAEEIEERTGKKMSRQNLTQRLGRDNFQEQDMRMIANILGCSFQLSILATSEAAEKASVIEEVPPTGRELEKMLAKQKLKMDRAHAKKQAEAEAAERAAKEQEKAPQEEPLSPEEEEARRQAEAEEEARRKEEMERKAAEWEAEAQRAAEREAEARRQALERAQKEAEAQRMQAAEQAAEQEAEEQAVKQEAEQAEEAAPEEVEEQTEAPQKNESKLEKIAKLISAPKKEENKKSNRFQPIKQRADEEEDTEKGDVNPYTGHEYQSNSVRMHPKRIGYVQVYDRKEHKWTDMTEWAFLGFEERKKATLGRDYEPPIYLD